MPPAKPGFKRQPSKIEVDDCDNKPISLKKFLSAAVESVFGISHAKAVWDVASAEDQEREEGFRAQMIDHTGS
jgi:hypothetical protein